MEDGHASVFEVGRRDIKDDIVGEAETLTTGIHVNRKLMGVYVVARRTTTAALRNALECVEWALNLASYVEVNGSGRS